MPSGQREHASTVGGASEARQRSATEEKTAHSSPSSSMRGAAGAAAAKVEDMDDDDNDDDDDDNDDDDEKDSDAAAVLAIEAGAGCHCDCRGPRPRDGLRRRLVRDAAPRHHRRELRAAFRLDDRHVAESAAPDWRRREVERRGGRSDLVLSVHWLSSLLSRSGLWAPGIGSVFGYDQVR